MTPPRARPSPRRAHTLSRRPAPTTGPARIGAAVVLAVVVAVFGVLPLADPAEGRARQNTSEERAEAEAAAAPAALELVDQTPVVAASGTFTARIDLGPALDALDAADSDTGDTADTAAGPGQGRAGLDVAVTVHSRLEDAWSLSAPPASPLNRRPPVPLDELAVDNDGVLRLEMPIRSGEPFDDLERVRIPDPGVYPVVVDLRRDEAIVGSIVLYLIRLPVEPEEPSRPTADQRGLVLVLAVGSPDGLTITEAIAVLGRHPDLAATVLVTPEVVGRLENERALARSFVAAVAGRPVAAPTEPRLDPSALAAIGYGDLYIEAGAAMSTRLSSLGLAPATGVDVVDGALTQAGTELVANTGVGVVIDTNGPSERADPDGTVTPPAWLAAGNRGSIVVLRPAGPPGEAGAAEPGTGTGGGGADGGPVVAAHRELARLMLRAPSDGPVVLGGAPADSPGPLADPQVLGNFLDLVSLVAGGADAGDTAAGGTRPVRLLTLAEAARAASPGSLPAAERPDQDLGPAGEPLARALDLLATYDGFHAGGPGSPATYRAELVAALDTGRSDDERLAALDAINAELWDGLGRISLPGNQSVTVAARRVPIPLTIANSAPGARNVLLRFRSDKIVVAEQGQVITVEPGTSSIDIEVEARSLGQSPLEVTVLTPDGRHVLSTTRFRVRSTAVPGLGLAISAAGLAGLAVWWYVSIRRGTGSRRGRRRRPRPSDTEGAGSAPDDRAGGAPPGIEARDGSERSSSLVGDSVER